MSACTQSPHKHLSLMSWRKWQHTNENSRSRPSGWQQYLHAHDARTCQTQMPDCFTSLCIGGETNTSFKEGAQAILEGCLHLITKLSKNMRWESWRFVTCILMMRCCWSRRASEAWRGCKSYRNMSRGVCHRLGRDTNTFLQSVC